MSSQRQRSAWALRRLVKGWTQADYSGLSMLSRFKLEVFHMLKVGTEETKQNQLEKQLELSR